MTDIDTSTTFEFRPYVPEGHEKPTTVKEVLQSTHALISEEGRWLQGDWFKNQHPEHDPEDPFCNSWGVCLDGALLIVTVGSLRETYWSTFRQERVNTNWTCSTAPTDRMFEGSVDPEAARLYGATRTFLEDRLPEYEVVSEYDDDEAYTTQYESIPSFNDHDLTTRTDVLTFLQEAIKEAN